ncbi:RNA-binding protein 4.1-like [Thalassophryne amazonica]|uniref:RNA-binding protein 4.1-like n=1 Tax=Thalassophryne amazonica TaxID=390379 RepID=UPI00147236ED|nr:RNA-binding protein 4.1-like [Thalassophryne amazonica]
MNVQLSTSRLRTSAGMGEHTGCYVCGKHGHWSKDCPFNRNGSYSDDSRGRSGHGLPRGPFGFGSYRMGAPPASAYSRASYLGGLPPPSRRLSGYGPEPADRYVRVGPDRVYSSVDYYDKYRSYSYGSSYFEDRRMPYIPPPPPPPSASLSKVSSVDRRPVAPPSAASYYARDRSPIRRVPVSAAGYAYERTRLSPVSASRSSYGVARPKDHYAARYAPY